MLKAFHHISLLTKNGSDNLHFYTEVLGLRFVKNTVNQDNHRMLHYYYGDYQGTPGTVVTFFVVPHLGHRYDNDHFIATLGLQIPKGSLDYWQKRLEAAGTAVAATEGQLAFLDPDEVAVTLTEVDLPPLASDHLVKNEIPADKQIIGIHSSEIHVADAAKTSDFFKQLLDWDTVDGTLQLTNGGFVAIKETGTTEQMHMGKGSIDHIAFAVEDDDALQALMEKAQAQQWQIEKIISRGYFKSLYIREPGGNRMEFATLAPGFTIDEPLDSLGESFALPPFLADQRQEIIENLYDDELTLALKNSLNVGE